MIQRIQTLYLGVAAVLLITAGIVLTSGGSEKALSDNPQANALYEDGTADMEAFRCQAAIVKLDEALQLLSQPRNLGDHPETGESIMVQNGRYGPYIKSGKDTRSLESEEEIFTIDGVDPDNPPPAAVIVEEGEGEEEEEDEE